MVGRLDSSGWGLWKEKSRSHEDQAGNSSCKVFTNEVFLNEGMQFAGNFCLPEIRK